jgi:hypothetical protein
MDDSEKLETLSTRDRTKTNININIEMILMFGYLHILLFISY